MLEARRLQHGGNVVAQVTVTTFVESQANSCRQQEASATFPKWHEWERPIPFRARRGLLGCKQRLSLPLVQSRNRPMLYLASQSPRRLELLHQLGATFSLLNVNVLERRAATEVPQAYVERVAREKALAGLASLAHAERAVALVLGADTEVVLDGEVFGKPADARAAAVMLRRLSGRTHTVISAVCLTSVERETSAVSLSQVRFDTLDESSIVAYIATGESFGKAGAYAIQGRGARLIEHLQGSYSGVMGLPLFETSRLLRERHVTLD